MNEHEAYLREVAGLVEPIAAERMSAAADEIKRMEAEVELVAFLSRKHIKVKRLPHGGVIVYHRISGVEGCGANVIDAARLAMKAEEES